MSMIYVLIPLAVVLIALALWALVWAIRSGQFDDLDAQGWSVVLDDDEKPPAQSERGSPRGRTTPAPERDDENDDESDPEPGP